MVRSGRPGETERRDVAAVGGGDGGGVGGGGGGGVGGAAGRWGVAPVRPGEPQAEC